MKRDIDEWKLNFFPLTTSGLLFFYFNQIYFLFHTLLSYRFFFQSYACCEFFCAAVCENEIDSARTARCLFACRWKAFSDTFFSSSMWTAGLVNRKGRKLNWRNGIILWNSTQVDQVCVCWENSREFQFQDLMPSIYLAEYCKSD